jgi:hypothetical protein
MRFEMCSEAGRPRLTPAFFMFQPQWQEEPTHYLQHAVPR